MKKTVLFGIIATIMAGTLVLGGCKNEEKKSKELESIENMTDAPTVNSYASTASMTVELSKFPVTSDVAEKFVNIVNGKTYNVGDTISFEELGLSDEEKAGFSKLVGLAFRTAAEYDESTMTVSVEKEVKLDVTLEDNLIHVAYKAKE